MIRGSCLCRAVRWDYDGAFDRMVHCHCEMCRKAHAAPFATYAGGPRAALDYVSGRDAITNYESSPGFVRAFCAHCGSVVPTPEGGERVTVPAGCLDDDPGIEASAHIFVKWKAPWHVITDALPRYDHYPHDEAPAVARAGKSPSTGGVLRGSCLCGDVAYEITGGFKVVHNCHCSRCRKARAAAHTTNGFTAIDDTRYTRGGDTIKTYRYTGARYFSQVFCPTCGSGLPRLDPERKLAVVPFGSLDDDPGRGADDHIFVGSKASWYPITDALPRFDQAPG
jgi:hypothetical protein